jgi:hypothetical protein
MTVPVDFDVLSAVDRNVVLYTQYLYVTNDHQCLNAYL